MCRIYTDHGGYFKISFLLLVSGFLLVTLDEVLCQINNVNNEHGGIHKRRRIRRQHKAVYDKCNATNGIYDANFNLIAC